MMYLRLVGGFDLNHMINVTLDEVIIYLLLSIVLGLIFHFALSSKQIDSTEEETIISKSIPLKTKIVLVFITLVIVFVPVFKLLNTGYFL
ncbi:hypothetical protein [uncultured Tenacibaculum sp.]|uniref:hypothetical protein n=1 Tax=uncultured Tenacibaculum sp. TaxID=174713 RepID=UPI00262A17EB|nr:hypothetical protein [uncultured Tenacibaculum sp.]